MLRKANANPSKPRTTACGKAGAAHSISSRHISTGPVGNAEQGEPSWPSNDACLPRDGITHAAFRGPRQERPIEGRGGLVLRLEVIGERDLIDRRGEAYGIDVAET